MAYTNKQSTKLECTLCPHNCKIALGKSGICFVRTNNKMHLGLPFKGILSAVNIDPIEKKPLNRFLPGSKILSIGFYGCNFHCQFCQNYTISQGTELSDKNNYFSPLEIIEMAKKKGLKSIAYTYSEPVIHFEYIMECAQLARKNGINNVLITNGFLNPEPAKELLSLMDGVNVDLKAFTQSFYNKVGGKIEPVKDFIKLAAELTHLEITTLIIPGENDSDKEILDIANFIASLNPDIPLHISAYYPVYKSAIPGTSKETILRLTKLASEVLNYIYPGNIY